MFNIPMSNSAEAVILKCPVAHHLRIEATVVGWAMLTTGNVAIANSAIFVITCCTFRVSCLIDREATPIINPPSFVVTKTGKRLLKSKTAYRDQGYLSTLTWV